MTLVDSGLRGTRDQDFGSKGRDCIKAGIVLLAKRTIVVMGQTLRMAVAQHGKLADTKHQCQQQSHDIGLSCGMRRNCSAIKEIQHWTIARTGTNQLVRSGHGWKRNPPSMSSAYGEATSILLNLFC